MGAPSTKRVPPIEHMIFTRSSVSSVSLREYFEFVSPHDPRPAFLQHALVVGSVAGSRPIERMQSSPVLSSPIPLYDIDVLFASPVTIIVLLHCDTNSK